MARRTKKLDKFSVVVSVKRTRHLWMCSGCKEFGIIEYPTSCNIGLLDLEMRKGHIAKVASKDCRPVVLSATLAYHNIDNVIVVSVENFEFLLGVIAKYKQQPTIQISAQRVMEHSAMKAALP